MLQSYAGTGLRVLCYDDDLDDYNNGDETTLSQKKEEDLICTLN